MLDLVPILGGWLTIVVGLISKINDPLADFTMDNLMMRKLYSVNKSDDPLFQTKQFRENLFGQFGYFYEYMA